MRRRFLLLILLALSAQLLLVGCRALRSAAAKYPAPDIEAVYQPSVPTAAAAERNPVVVIPGFGGSEVRNGAGLAVWGARFTNDSLSFGRPEGLRALALRVPDDIRSMPEEEALALLYDLVDDDSSITDSMLFFRTEVVAEVHVPVYAGLLQGLAAGGYQMVPRQLAERLGAPDNPDGAPCFVFPFDWRRDLAGSAAELGRFLDRAEADVRELRRRRGADPSQPVHFDLVAHSMGGLVVRYYLRYGAQDVLSGDAWRRASERGEVPEVTWAGARRVDRAVLVSPPNRGTPAALRNLANGDNDPFIPTYEPAMVATWLSVPQMFPRREPTLITDAAGTEVDFDPFDAATWRRHRWGPYRPEQEEILRLLFPGVASPSERLGRLDALFSTSLERARRFVSVMDAPAQAPPHTTFHLFAGDAEPTLARGMIVRRDGGLELAFTAPKQRLLEPGDGSVTRRSALADLRPLGSKDWLRSSVPWHSVYFLSDRHAGFLSNRVFQDNLLHLLLETPPVRSRDVENRAQ